MLGWYGEPAIRVTHFLRFTFALVLLLWLFSSVLPASAATWTVHAQPTRLVNGGPVLFQVKSPARLESLGGTWLGHELSFSFDPASKTWFALAGVSLETVPGTYPIELIGLTAPGKMPGEKDLLHARFRRRPWKIS